MDIFGRKRKRLQKSRNDALHGVSCCYWPGTDERKEYNKVKQKIEDNSIECDIMIEANKRFNAWVNAPVIKFGKEEFKSPPIFMPFIHIYNLHDESTAKFLHINTEDIVREEFNKLKANYCNQHNVYMGLKHFKADNFIFTTTDVADKFSSAKK